MLNTANLSQNSQFSQLLKRLPHKKTTKLPRGAVIFTQGDRADSVYCNVKGTVLLSIVSQNGKEGVVEIVAAGEMFGETCILENNQQFRTCSAMTLDPTSVICLDQAEVRMILKHSPECAEEFMRHLVKRNHKIQEHLADQLFHSSELRLARTLRILANSGEKDAESAPVPRISQSTLAAMVGTTRSRISHFLVKFRKMGIVERRQGLRVNTVMIDALLEQQESLS